MGHRSRRRGRSGVAAAVLASALAVAGGCAGNRDGKVSTRDGVTYAGSAANAPAKAPDAIETAAMRERALAMLVEGVTSESAEQRANSIEALTAVPSRLRALLPAALADENVGVRTVAGMAVGRLRLRELVHAVRPLIHDASPMAQMAGIYALYRCGDTGPDANLTPLAAMLQHESPRVRAQAAFVLGELGERSASQMLKESLRHLPIRAMHSEVRMMQLQVAEARVKLGDEEPLHELRAALYPSRVDDLESAALAAQILGLVGDRRSIDNLIYLTARTDETGRLMPAEIRLAAAASLARLGVRQGGFIAREYAGDPQSVLRAQSALVFGETGLAENLPALDEMMGDPDPIVRTAAAAGVLKITERPASTGRFR